MFTSAELERFSMLLDKPMNELEMRIMTDIVRRIKDNGEITRAADWQINRLYQLGLSYDEIDAAIAQALGLSESDMEALYSDIISKGYARDKRLYDKTGTPFIPFEENEELRQLISSVAAQTSERLENITQSLGFAVNQNGSLTFLPIAKYYQSTLDSAMLDIASGAFDYNTVLRRVVADMTNSGLRSVDYASGHSNRVEVAARRALQTGIGQLTDKVNNDNAEALGTDHFEVTVSRCARPTHAVWQGRVYSSTDLVRVCGLGRVDGLCGANCYHDKHPFIPGISERVYSDEELDELRRQENTPREWNGKQYTAYEASQRQRRLETTMRAQRQKIKLLEEGGASDDELIAARARYRATSAEYSRFSQAMGIPQQRERMTVDGLGNVGQVMYKVSNNSSDESDISRAFNAMTGRKYKNTVEDFSDGLKTLKNKKVKSVFEKAAKDAEYAKSDRKNSYYNPKTKRIFLAKSASPSTVAHEVFHKIDRDNNISFGGMLDKCIADDYKKLIKTAEKAGQSLEDMLYLMYPKAFEEKGKLKVEYRGISDIIHGMTKGKTNLGYGHRISYWEKPYNLQKETFAQYGRMYFEEDDDVLKMLKELFVDTTAQIDSIILKLSQPRR